MRLLLLGDSIRRGYAPHVAAALEGVATVISPAKNGWDTNKFLRELDGWLTEGVADVVHFNSGLHDLKVKKGEGRPVTGLREYGGNLRAMVARMRERTNARLVFALTTPIIDERHARPDFEYDRTDAAVRRYNDTARAVMGELGVPVNDLYAFVVSRGAEELMREDGTHFTPAGSVMLAGAVVAAVRGVWDGSGAAS